MYRLPRALGEDGFYFASYGVLPTGELAWRYAGTRFRMPTLVGAKLDAEVALLTARMLEPAAYAEVKRRAEASKRWARRVYGTLEVNELTYVMPWDFDPYNIDRVDQLHRRVAAIWSQTDGESSISHPNIHKSTDEDAGANG